MEQIDQLLGESGTDLGAIGARLGLSPDQARTAMASLLPAVAGGFQKQEGGGNLPQVAQLASTAQPAESTASGNAILGQIFGSKDVSRQVAAHAAGRSGLPDGVMKALLPIVASLVAQHLMRRMGGGAGTTGGMGGGLGGILGSVLGGAQPAGGGAAQPGGGGLGGMLGSLLDRDGNGNPLDDILGGLAHPRR